MPWPDNSNPHNPHICHVLSANFPMQSAPQSSWSYVVIFPLKCSIPVATWYPMSCPTDTWFQTAIHNNENWFIIVFNWPPGSHFTQANRHQWFISNLIKASITEFHLWDSVSQKTVSHITHCVSQKPFSSCNYYSFGADKWSFTQPLDELGDWMSRKLLPII